MNSTSIDTSVTIDLWDWKIDDALRNPQTGVLNVRPALIAAGARKMELSTNEINQQLDAMQAATEQLDALNSLSTVTLANYSVQDYYTALNNKLTNLASNPPNALTGAYLGLDNKAHAFISAPNTTASVFLQDTIAPTDHRLLDFSTGNLLTSTAYEGRVLRLVDQAGDRTYGYFHDDGNGHNYWPLTVGYVFSDGANFPGQRVPDPATTIAVPGAVPVDGKLVDSTGRLVENPDYEGKVLAFAATQWNGTKYTAYFYYHNDGAGHNVQPVDVSPFTTIRIPTQAELDAIKSGAADQAQVQSRTTEAKQTFIQQLMVDLQAAHDFTSNMIERKERDQRVFAQNIA